MKSLLTNTSIVLGLFLAFAITIYLLIQFKGYLGSFLMVAIFVAVKLLLTGLVLGVKRD